MLTTTNSQLDLPLILIADDDVTSRAMLRQVLESEGYTVAEASDGTQALKQVVLLRPTLLLLDVVMPGLSGFEVCARLRASHQSVPVIILTAYNDGESIDRAYKAGADDYVAKPIDWRMLTHRVAALAQAEHSRHLLEEERNFLRTLIDNIPDYIFVKDAQGRFVVSNIAHARAVHAESADELIGKTAFDFWPEDLASQYRADDQRVIDTGQSLINAERMTLDAEGEVRAVLTTKIPLHSEKGNSTYLIGISRDITERKRAEEALAVTTHQLNNLLDSLDEVFFSLDEVNCQTLQMSPTCEKVFGVSRHAFFDNPGLLRQLAHRETQALISAVHERLVAGEAVHSEYRIVRPDGEMRWIETKIKPILDGEGHLMRVDGLATDVTRRYEAEEALRHSETQERMQRVQAEALHDIAKAITGTLDVNLVMGRILDNAGRVLPHDTANIMLIGSDTARAVYWHGYDADAEPAISNLVMPIHQIPYLHQMATTGEPCLVGDTTGDAEWIGISAVSEVVSYIGAPIRIQGQLIGFLNFNSQTPGFFTQADLERIQALADLAAIALQNAQLFESLRLHAENMEERVAQRTAELQHERDLLQALMDNIPDYIYFKDTSSAFTRVNHSLAQAMGISELNKALGKTEFDFLSAPLAQQFIEDEQQLFRAGKPIIDQIEFNPAADGQERWFSTTKVPIRDKDGAVIGLVGISRNITEHKRLEANLRQALEEQKELSALKTRFITMASHEFRTPLTIITSSTSLMELSIEKMAPEQRAKHFTKIQTSVKQIVELLDDVLMIGQAEAGSLELKSEPLDLENFCRDIVDEMNAASPHQIIYSCADACSDILADKKLLRQIVTNLLSNALKYSPESSPVYLNLLCHSGQAKLEVKDAGIGIPEECQSHLFDAFYRAKNVGKIKGTGLGLAIVEKAVELHGGSIQFESKVGSGTTFTVTLPML